MLARQQLQPLFQVYRLFTKIGFYPISLDFKSGEIRAQRYKLRWLLWWSFVVLVTCRALLGTLRLVSVAVSSDGLSADEIPLMLNQLFYWGSAYALHVILNKNLDVTICVFNSLLQGPVRKKPWRNLTLQEMVVILVLPVDCFVIAGLYAAVLALQPKAAYNVFAAINPPWQTVPVLIAIVLIEASITLYIFACITLTAHIMLLFFQKCTEETQIILKLIGARHIQNENLNAVTIEHALKNLRRLQLLILVYNGGYRFIHFFIKVLTLFWYIASISCGILAVNSNPFMSCAYFFMGTESSALYCTIFHKAFAIPMSTKKVNSRLSSFIKTTTGGDTRRVYEKWIRSIPPIGIKVGNFHTFERMSTPNFLGFGLKNISRAVITYRNRSP